MAEGLTVPRRNKRWLSFREPRKSEVWPTALDWMAKPSALSGAGSVADMFGTLPLYDARRFLWTADRTMLNHDFAVVARDFTNSFKFFVAEAKVGADQEQLFDPDALDAPRERQP
jgi:hypothetical protein